GGPLLRQRRHGHQLCRRAGGLPAVPRGSAGGHGPQRGQPADADHGGHRPHPRRAGLRVRPGLAAGAAAAGRGAGGERAPLSSMIRDPSLAPSGWRKLRWVEARMPILAHLRSRIRAEGWLRGRRIAICLHLEAKTAHLARILQEAGAEVAICGSNPLSTQDDVAAALAETGVRVYAWHGADTAQYREFIRRTVEFGPELVIDDGGDLVNVLHNERADLADGVLGGSEETTTGVQRLRAMAAEGALRFPMIAANDSRAKYLFDNRYGTGQSVWDGIMRATNLVVAGKTVVVIGYGWCGKGVALRARGLGARVVVCEVDPVAANEALLDGCEVMPSLKAAEVGDI